MHVSALERRIDELVHELAQYHGFRTLWLDARGQLRHSEPDDELEQLGWVYVATLDQPDREQLSEALTGVVPIELGAPGVTAWKPAATPGIETVLIPAQAG
jgi:hypothetical protein